MTSNTPSPNPAPPPRGNPFTPGGAITSRDQFFGRKRELSEIKARLEGMLSVSVVGEARIGKSSLLKVLEAELRQWPDYLPIYLSMDSYGTQAGFCRILLEKLLPHVVPPTGKEQVLRALEGRVEQQDESLTFEETAKVIEWAHASGRRVVLLLDEFKDLLEKADEFDDAFLGQLRSLYNTNRTLALVLATRKAMTTIPELKAYFANGIIMQELKELLPSEARALLEQPHDRPFSPQEVDLGLQVGKKHPLRLQSAGFWLYYWKGQADNPLYSAPGHLHINRYNILNQKVQDEYEQAMAASQESNERIHDIGDSLNRGTQWLNRSIVQPIRRLIEFIANSQGNLAAILFLLVIVVSVLSFLGIIPTNTVKQLLDWIKEGL